VLGPLYGALLAAAIGWRGLFWVNIPLAFGAVLVIGRTRPGRGPRPEQKVDLVGGAILAAALAAVIIGLYNPDPAAGVLPPWGIWLVAAGVGGFVGFALWERRSPVRVLAPASGRGGTFAAAVGTSFLSGVALMVTLVDVPLLAQTLLGKKSLGAAVLLSRFLIALALGALTGGFAAKRLGERPVALAGLVGAASAFFLVSRWPLAVLSARHHLGPLSVPRLDADLVLAGLSLGLVVAPLASVALRSSRAEDHGAASAAIVTARMTGMLVGIGALAAWGFQVAAYERAFRLALHTEYGEIFRITAVVCVFAAMWALALGRAPAREGAS
jgi:MFS family permease